MKIQSLVCVLLTLAAGAFAGAADLPPVAHVRVAFVISDGFNVMDLAGPWEVFQDVMLPTSQPGEDMQMPYELYTVAASTNPVSSTGGATVVPSYTFANAPRPDIIVVGAQSDNSEVMLDWLRAQYANKVIVMSVCTGARKLALAGLLNGRPATSHHEYLHELGEHFPAVKWQPARRFVRADEGLYTAGGLTSGIDLALHLVANRFGTHAAQTTADFMEYRSDGWKQAE